MSLPSSWSTLTRSDNARRAVEAAKELGLPYIPDVNSPTHPPFGCARLHFTIDRDDHRHSAYHAFLPRDIALSRKDRLHVCTNTIVERLETERAKNGNLVVTGVVLGPTVEGARMVKRRSVRVRKEVVLCAGPFGSPQILMLRRVHNAGAASALLTMGVSGIGPAEHLKDIGITVVNDLPAVGSNLVRTM